MAEYSLTTPTVVAVGSAVPYDNVIINGCCNITHRAGSGIIKVKGGTCCHPNKYTVRFHGLVLGVAGPIQLGIYLDGELLPESLTAVVPEATADVWGIDTETQLLAVGDYESISVRVVAGAPLTVDRASIIVTKEVA